MKDSAEEGRKRKQAYRDVYTPTEKDSTEKGIIILYSVGGRGEEKDGRT